MTKEQQIQYALKQALEEALESLELSVVVHAVQLDNAPLSDNDTETYPAVTISTGMPVPIGHKSAILDIQCWVRIMSYLPDDRKREYFSQIKEAVFNKIHDTEDWSEYEVEEKTIEINAVVIDSSEEPELSGMLIVQPFKCMIHAENKS